MKDVNIRPGGDSPAEKAVNYMLQRIRVDANLRWYMIGTQAFALLLEAEGARLGKSAEEVEREVLANCDGEEADIVRLRRELIRCDQELEQMREGD